MADVYREESGSGIKAAMAKAAELRALHAALMQQHSPAAAAIPSASPISRHASHLSAQDYPVFTPVCIVFPSFFFSFTLMFYLSYLVD